LPLTAEETMLQLTALRTRGIEGAGAPIIVANAAHADIIDAQLAAISVTGGTIVLEPTGRNTAPAIALAALLSPDPAAALLVMPSDHVIADVAAFHDAIAQALPLVEDGWLVTFGITPNAPETGYGYIGMGEPLSPRARRVDRFLEKPTADRAAAMLAEGGYAWNAGIFLFRADAYLEALGAHRPDMLGAVRASVSGGRADGLLFHPDAEAFAACPSDSIDYAVMENADKVACVPVDMGWSDVGSWDSLHEISDQDQQGNVARGEVLSLGTSGCLVHSDGPRIALVDVKDLIVVASGGDILILPRGKSQDVRCVTEALKAKK
jgi:mannose-1-phosphate guanylyltransferase/mannose-1-phosphate guanylyltransferase/mannose-6-phosphate isomerase